MAQLEEKVGRSRKEGMDKRAAPALIR